MNEEVVKTSADIYETVLHLMYELLSKLKVKYWADQIKTDIELWQKSRTVEHHFSAFHKDGLSDLWLFAENGFNIKTKQEPWAMALHKILCTLSLNAARQIRSSGKADTCKVLAAFQSKPDSKIIGHCCCSCKFTMLTQWNVDNYIAPAIIFEEFCKRLNNGGLNNLVDDVLSLNISKIAEERARMEKAARLLGISFDEANETNEFMRVCKKCGGNNTAVCRFTEKRSRLRRRTVLVREK